MEKDNESSLEELKKDYLKLSKKYNLPGFEDMNEDFHIEKIASVETDILIREIGRLVAEKFSNYLRFVEAILNPVSPQLFIFSVIKSINSEEKEKLKEVYKKLSKIEVRVIEVDISYKQEKEVEFIKDCYKVWQEIKKDLLDVIEVVKKNWDNKFEVNGKSYFG